MMTEDEALQTCAEVFSRCRAKYCRPRRLLRGVDNAAWFMSLYKQALSREFADAATQCARMRDSDAMFAEAQSQENEDYNLGGVLALLTGASEELREVLQIVARAPGELLEILLTEADDETWSRRLCRLCGIRRVNDGIIAELRQLLSPEES